MHFRQHGSFEITTVDSVMIVDATGPYNEEAIPKYHDAIEAAIRSFSGGQWQQIIVVREQSVFTPKAERGLLKTLAYRKSRGLSASAVVLLNCQGEALTRQQLSRCYEKVGIAYCFFNSIADAQQWLTEAFARSVEE